MATALTHRVECRSTLPFFEHIAGFNCEAPAKWYAEQCSETNPQNTYRVKRGSVLIAEYGRAES